MSILIVLMISVPLLPAELIPQGPIQEVTAGLSDESNLTIRGHISIMANWQFNSSNGVSSGNGTSSNPYIIENWKIYNASGPAGIKIWDTSAHFIIRNCHLVNGGFTLFLAKNGIVKDCRIRNNTNGVYMYGSENITVTNCSARNSSSDCFFIRDCNNVTISNNNIDHGSSTGTGLRVQTVNDLHVRSNIIKYNSYGIKIDACIKVEMGNNQIINNTDYGIYIKNMEEGTLYNNSILNSTINFYIYGTSNKYYFHNVATNNTIDDIPMYYLNDKSDIEIPDQVSYIALIDCDNITINNGSFRDLYIGLLMYNSTNCTIKNIQISNNSYGIRLYYSDNNLFENINLHDNEHTFIMFDSNNNKIINSSNLSSSSGNNVVFLQNSNGNIFHNNIISDKKKSNNLILIKQSSYNRFLKNNMWGNAYGIYVDSSQHNSFLNNNIKDVYYGIFSVNSPYNTIANNTIDASTRSIQFTRSNYNVIHDNHFTNDNGKNIYLGYADHNIIYNYSSSNGQYGIYSTYSNYNSILNSSFNKNTKSAIYLWNSNNNFIHNISVFNSDIGIILSYSSNNIISNSTINDTTQFAILCESISNENRIMNNNIFNNTGNGLEIVTSFNNIIGHNSINNNIKNGIRIYGLDNNTILNNSIFDNSINGLLIESSSECHINNNSIYDNTFRGLYLINSNLSIIRSNNLHGNGNSGIRLSSSPDNTINNNNIHDHSQQGLDLDNSDNNKVDNNTLDQNDYGIYSDNGDNNEIMNNIVYRNDLYNIYLRNSDNNEVTNNTCFDSPKGIYLYQTSNCDVSFNTVINNTEGIYLSSSNSNYILNNSVNNNTNGLRFFQSSGLNVCHNFLIDNSQGIYSEGTGGNNNVMDNYFNNTNNHNILGGSYTWDSSRTRGTNLIGGPYLGGNFWSDYSGVDTDGDGLGNTGIPFGPGDNNPLTYNINDTAKPDVIDTTTGNPETNKTFSLTAKANDFSGVKAVHVVYWFDSGVKTNLTMTLIAGDKHDGSYKKDIDVNETVRILYYYYTVFDMINNWNTNSIASLNVFDTTKPTIIDYSEENVTTGEEYAFLAYVYDNRNISRVEVQYWFDTGPITTLQMVIFTIVYVQIVTIPSDAKILNYIFTARDFYNNEASLYPPPKDVIDNDKPEIIGYTKDIVKPGGKCNFKFLLSDNIGISRAILRYTFDDNAPNSVQLPSSWTYSVVVPRDALQILVNLSVFDAYDNGAYLEYTLNVSDDVSPTINDLTKEVPETGGSFSIHYSVIDDSNISSNSVQYWFDYGPRTTITPTDAGENKYQCSFNVPNTAEKLHYRIIVDDIHENSAERQFLKDVIDIIPPVLFDNTTGNPTTGDPFKINIYAEDNIGAQSMYIEYWFDSKDHKTVSIDKSLHVLVPFDARMLHYIITVYDYNGNFDTKTNDFEVIDNDPPLITDKSPGTSYPGRFDFVLFFSDNIEYKSASMEYWFDDGTHVLVQVNGTNFVIIPKYVETLNYIITAKDWLDNTGSKTRTVIIIDNIEPDIKDLSGQNGDHFIFEADINDNREVVKGSVNYRFNNDKQKSIELELINGSYSANISIPKDAGNIYYSITAVDTKGNTQTLDERTVVISWEHHEIPDDVVPDDGPEEPEETETPEPEKEEKDNSGLIAGISIVVIVIVIILMFLFVIKPRIDSGKTADPGEDSEQKGTQSQGSLSADKSNTGQSDLHMQCPTCGKPVAIQSGWDYNYCSNCQKYLMK